MKKTYMAPEMQCTGVAPVTLMELSGDNTTGDQSGTSTGSDDDSDNSNVGVNFGDYDAWDGEDGDVISNPGFASNNKL